MERLKSRYPDRQFDDDEATFGQISDDYDDYDAKLSKYKDHEDKLAAMMGSDPRSAHFLMSWKDGADPVVELVRQFGTDIKDAVDDPARQEEIAAANKDFVERVAKEKELEETYQKNLEKSLQGLDELQKARGLSDEEVDKAMELLIGIVKDGVMGKFDTESIEMAMKALHHDDDVAAAGHEGEVRGKNTKIRQQLRKEQQGDGTARLGGTSVTGGKPKRAQTIFELAEEAR